MNFEDQMAKKFKEMKEARDMVKQNEDDRQLRDEELHRYRNEYKKLTEEGKSDAEIDAIWREYGNEYAEGKKVWLQLLSEEKSESEIDAQLSKITPHYQRFKKLWEIDIRDES